MRNTGSMLSYLYIPMRRVNYRYHIEVTNNHYTFYCDLIFLIAANIFRLERII